MGRQAERADSLTDRTILITGATGFVGGAFASSMASGADQIVVHIRANTIAGARERLFRSISRFLPLGDAYEAVEQSAILLGDLAVEGDLEHPALDAVTHVVHAAACTSFASTREVWRSNVDATARLLERVRRAPRFERFLHVSTAYCCGDRPARVVCEGDSPSPAHTYVNEYTRSKAEAERLVLVAASDLPVLVVRPSAIVGHSTLGVGPSSSLFWYYRALAALGAGPFNVGAYRDVVPVDYVADTIGFLLCLERPRSLSYHVSAGERSRTLWIDILRAFVGATGWRTVSPTELGGMRDAIRTLVRTDEEAKALARGLVACGEFGRLGVDHFDNERLMGEGFRAPPPFTDYLPRCIESTGAATVYEQMVDEA